MIKVSIIVPVYNEELYLETCIKSLLNQSLKEIEIIFVDDASKDGSLSILKKYEEMYPNKIRVYHNEVNLGQGLTRNIGIDASLGKYISFVDSDDYINSKMLEIMYNKAILNNADIVSCGISFVKDDSKLDEDIYSNTIGYLYNPLEDKEKLLDESISSSNKIYKKEFINNFRFIEGMWEDIAFTYGALFNAKLVYHLNMPLYYYRKRKSNSVSSRGFNINPKLLDIFKVVDDLYKNTRNCSNKLDDVIDFVIKRSILQRMGEVLKWDISDIKKEMIIMDMFIKTKKLYGDFRSLDLDLMSSFIGIIELEQIKEIITKNEIKKTWR